MLNDPGNVCVPANISGTVIYTRRILGGVPENISGTVIYTRRVLGGVPENISGTVIYTRRGLGDVPENISGTRTTDILWYTAQDQHAVHGGQYGIFSF